MKIISDSGPILSFARAGRLETLRQVVGEIIIPAAVFAEISIRGKGKPGAADVESAGWIKREHIKNRATLKSIIPKTKPWRNGGVGTSRRAKCHSPH